MHSFVCFTVFAILFDSLVTAISITEPTANSTYAAGSTITVNWNTVDTDPSYFSLYLWNFVSWPPSYVALAIDIPTADESYSVQIPCDTNPEWGYQLSAINGTNVYIIYAQGERFTVSSPLNGSHCVDSVPSNTTCGATTTVSTVYVTVSPTASSSPSSPHHHGHPHHPPSSPSLSPATTATSSVYTKPGIVPKTIGWCSDYSHPVTLDHPPVPAAAIPTAAPGQASSMKPVFVTTVTTTIGVPAPEGDARCRAF
ncbi:Ser-Thr-rich glycosyl-phosphatidyl-inositol-anchored membrane family-domain-containing protein [Aspergillus nidulans var. acristatus]|jgi:hypothetical protein